MRSFILLLIALLTTLIWPTAFANTNPTEKKADRKICLVLSGGGARGFAHIGVLKYLEEQRIPVDCITGTSMGAVVGGLYASGMSANEIEKKLNGMNLNNVALDVVDRRELPQPLREDDYNYTIGGTYGVSKEGVTLPLGAVQANQFLEILQNWTSQLPPNISFDELPIPFRSVATDLGTGEMVVFNKGPLSTAIRASMSAPGVFAPIEYDGRLLTDGGLVRNLPVDIAKQMGADIVIAVNIGTPLLPRNSLNNFVNISQQMINILTEQNVNEQKKLLTSNDILIDADLGTIRFLDFNRAQEALKIGYESADAVHNQLAGLSLTQDRYLAHLKERPNPVLPPIKIAFVDVDSNEKISADDIRRQLDIQIGSTYSAEEINHRITPLINSGHYETVTHAVVERNGEYGVEIDAVPLRWGPNFLRFGLELTTGYNGMSGFELQVGHRLPWINASGLEWRNDIQIGTIYKLHSELRQPLKHIEGIYLAPFVEVSQNSFSLYSDNDRIVDYALQTGILGVDLGIPLGSYGQKGEIRTGLSATNYRLRPKVGGVLTVLPDKQQILTPLPSIRQDELAVHSRFIIDQLDEPYFPSAGYLFGGEAIVGVNRNSGAQGDSQLHSDFREFHQFTLDGKWAKSDGNNSINLSMQAGVRGQSGESIPGIGLSLGGFQQLTAYQPEQFFGKYLLYGNATYLFRAINFDMFGQAIFVGTSLEVGNANDNRSEFSLPNLKKSLSIFAGAKTIIGPVYFGAAAAPGGAFNLFLQLGRQ